LPIFSVLPLCLSFTAGLRGNDGKTIHECRIARDLEGSGRTLTDVLFRHLNELRKSKNTFIALPWLHLVGIMIRYGLDVPGIEFQWERDFPHQSRPVMGAHPATYTTGNGSLSRGYSGLGLALTTHPI
jgi:hypothetical protein